MISPYRKLHQCLKFTSTVRSLSITTYPPSNPDPFLSHPSHHNLSTVDSTSSLLKSYTVTPPITRWPKRLFPKRLISMISYQQNLDLALQIFHHAGKYHPNFVHNYDTYLAIIQKLARARQFNHVETLLLELLKSDVTCGENLFIVVLRSYGLAGKPKSALRTFLRMKLYGVNQSVRSLNTLLNALIQNKRYDLVHLMFKNCRKKFGIIPNVFTANLLVKALCRNNDIESALKLLEQMPQMGMVPNVITYTTILGGYVCRGDLVGAKKVFSELLDRGWLPDATTYTILMDGYCRQGRLIDAIKVMDEMEENGVEPNDVTYGVMIEAYCKEKRSGESLNLISDMLEKKYVPNSSLCCKVIDVLCEDGKVDDACELWKKLLRKNVTPDNAISSTLIHWLCKKKKIWEARKLFDEFEKGSIPSVLTYNTIISGMCECGELQESARLWDDMVEKGCVPNAFTYNMLIKGFCKVGNAQEGIRVLEEMLDKGCLPNNYTFLILIEGLSEAGSEEDIFKVISLACSSLGGVGTDSWERFVTYVTDVLSSSTVLDRFLIEKSGS